MRLSGPRDTLVRGFQLLVLACGLNNPLALVWLGMRLFGVRPTVRGALALIALSMIPLTWVVIERGLGVESPALVKDLLR
jgi:hypothetical protein